MQTRTIKRIRQRLNMSAAEFGYVLGYRGANIARRVYDLEAGILALTRPRENLLRYIARYGVMDELRKPPRKPQDGR